MTIPGSTRPGTSADDRGSATVLVLAACLVLAVGSAIGVQVAGLVAVKHRAAAAADLAALAGADVATAGGDPCPAAGRAARLNRARLERCRQDGAVVTVSVSSGSPRLWGRRWRVERTARAAPSDWTLPASRAGPGG